MGAPARPRPAGPLLTVRAVLAVLTAILAACSDSGPRADLSGSRPVSFPASDGVRLEGRVFGEGTRGVALAHMRPVDQTSWFAFAERLADGGYLVLTFDFRGTCPGGDEGCSEGEPDVAGIWKDVVGAVGFLRDEGAASVALVGASMGGTAALVAAAQPDVEVDAVITVSAPRDVDGLVVDPTLLSQVSASKLFVAGVGDAPAASSAQALYDQAPPPKRVEIVPADEHGTDLLGGSQGEVVRRLIETYLETNGT